MENQLHTSVDITEIPATLQQNIVQWNHLKTPVDNNKLNILQINLRMKLIELLKLNTTLSATDFSQRKMDLLLMIPTDFLQEPTIQPLLKDIRELSPINKESRSALEIIKVFFKKFTK